MMKVESIADIAKRNIQEWIVTGQFQTGQQIKEEEISQRLGISRPPVREALKMLEAAGLVFRKPRCGVFVPEMTEKDMWEIYTLKATLYEMATALAMDVITEKEISRLESFVEKMEACVEKEPLDVLRYQDLHKTFHNNIMAIAGNDRLSTFASNLHNQVTLFSYKSLQDKNHLYSSVSYHREIINAMRKNDTSLACRLMKEHVLNALDVLRDMSAQVSEMQTGLRARELASV
ncbi:MAG: GntR family transcriptional regulator [Desulfobacteraceae bacterium]|nr:MAG: GntR family transcriptional regulator [Desulfobacteraceae bacterium]